VSTPKTGAKHRELFPEKILKSRRLALDPFGLDLALKPMFLALQQLIEFLQQLQKPAMVLFLFNQRAQLVHAFAFLRSHPP
jgi:hypothetical protein